MTSTSDAYRTIRSRIEANKPVAISTLCWQNERAHLPDEPAPLAYTEIVVERGGIAGYGGGRGANLYRNPAWIVIYVFVPKGGGLCDATDLAESFAALFRSYRSGGISCVEADVIPGGDGAMIKPAGLQSDVGNYYYAITEVSLHFDQIG